MTALRNARSPALRLSGATNIAARYAITPRPRRPIDTYKSTYHLPWALPPSHPVLANFTRQLEIPARVSENAFVMTHTVISWAPRMMMTTPGPRLFLAPDMVRRNEGVGRASTSGEFFRRPPRFGDKTAIIVRRTHLTPEKWS